jgi:hypothetical protein
MNAELLHALNEFRDTHAVKSKGKLAIIVFLSRVAKEKGLPLDAAQMVTGHGGQILGIGKAAVQKILAEHGIVRVLAEEAGRTSRGGIGLMQNYILFLNTLHSRNLVNADDIETWWADRVQDFFNARPFTLKYDTSKTIRATIRDLLVQAEARQHENPGTTYMGTVLQHLVGAKLSLIMPEGAFELHGASVADAPTARVGDFILEDVAIHCTTAPGTAVIEKCQRNIDAGLRPVIITTYSRLVVAESLAADAGIGGRVEVWDIEQFLATNVYELSKFRAADRRLTINRIIDAYNYIIQTCETDPSLRVELN